MAATARLPASLWFILLWFLCGCSSGERVEPAPCYEPATQLSSDQLCDILGADVCKTPSGPLPALSQAITVVPDAATMPAGIVSQKAHNNLDVVWHAGRLFFAFRTAPNHYASSEAQLYVVSTRDQQKWQLEASFQLGKDLREPRFLSIGDKLFLYFARLGEVPLTFNPEATMVSEQRAGCHWSPPREIDIVGKPGFIPWRARNIDGVSYLIGYQGGEDIYQLGEAGLSVYWLKTDNGIDFEPVVAGQPVVLTGGVSETDFAIVDNGSIVAVSRNESGDENDGFGSKICRAEASSPGDWTCMADPKKYDSPLVFAHDDEVYLIARRQVANDGKFDLGDSEKSLEEQLVDYQLAYWSTPKRCSLWRVDRDTLTSEWLLDLPSNGDTCFASAVELSDGKFLVYNYTSPLDNPELSWRDGQFGETYIYRLTLTLP